MYKMHVLEMISKESIEKLQLSLCVMLTATIFCSHFVDHHKNPLN